ncbi:MAG: formate--tetrahydrofolate ligase [Clostridiaceae bacterium]|jgi:formate--tetrahydrofolate ligase|nr:formate--tetrahydrofolate ligase [Clostridiaceae bacterium]
MRSDIEIAAAAVMRPIRDVARDAGLQDHEWEAYGQHKAKVNDAALQRLSGQPDGKLVLVTAINPTPAGEGKTTTTVGLGQALCQLGHRAIIALREPSLGPVFGIKGGAAGGGFSQVLPMEDINLHFTGDLHAVAAANNLLAALLDNHIQQGNRLNIDPRRIVWKRCLDINDRQLRHIVVGLGGKANGTPREDGFNITVASEIMAILCLAENLGDLKRRLKAVVVAWTYQDEPVTADQLGAAGSLAALLKEAIKPNLVQTLEGTPALIHGGPFANIAHGCNSVRATRLGLKLGDFLVTEAGFGADLGAEKFFDIKCRASGLVPAAAVIVATVRALKYNGGTDKTRFHEENLAALAAGLPNLGKHVENLNRFAVPCLVALNRFPSDTEAEIAAIRQYCARSGVRMIVSDVYTQGGAGGLELARALVDLTAGQPPAFRTLYADSLSLEEKIRTIAVEIYGADGISLAPAAARELSRFEQLGYGQLPICMAKTQYSLSDDPGKLGRPSGFTITVRGVSLSAGAGFVVALTGDIMTMPGLPKVPAAEKIDIDDEGNISGLF